MRILLLVLSAGALLWLCRPGRAVGEAERTIHPLHAFHAENEIDCETCHAEAWTSRSGEDELRPGMDLCADCHDVEDEEECGVCHVSVDDMQGYADRPVAIGRFPHAAHVENGMDCAACHTIGDGGEPRRPAKASCRGCHATASQMADCHVCHLESEPRIPVSHVPRWMQLHAIEAGWDQTGCQNCHTQSDCQDCHAGDNVRPRTHRLNYAFDHALEARGNEMRCATCHEDPQFCVACHATEQVLPRNHSRADWVLGSGGRHAEEARFDLESCIACHDAGTASPTCARCHGD